MRIRPAILAAALLAPATATTVPAYGPSYSNRPGPFAAPTRATAWVAEPLRLVVARSAPTATAPQRALLRPRTPARNVARYLVTGSATMTNGSVWVEILASGGTVPMTAWVPRGLVRVTRTDRRIEVRLGARRLTLYVAGRPALRVRVAVGGAATPTPTGLFAAREIVRHGRITGRALGSVAVALNATTATPNELPSVDNRLAIVGLGQNSRRLLGRPSTLGSIRIGNDAVSRLARVVRSGAPVVIVD